MTFNINGRIEKLSTKVQNYSQWFRGPTVSFTFLHQWKISMSLGGWVIVSFGWQSVHHPFKVRKMEQIKLGSTCPLHMPGCNQVQLKRTRLSGSEHGRHSISVKGFLYLWCLQAAQWEAWGQVALLHWPAAPWPAIDSDPENLEHLWPNLQKKPQNIRKLNLIKLNLLSQRGTKSLCFLVLSYLEYYLLYKNLEAVTMYAW